MKSEMEEMSCDERMRLIKDMKDLLGRTKLPKLEANCSIYKVPQGIRSANPAVYTPKVVSIGPLHHGDEGLKPMEELKLGYLKSYLERTKMELEVYIDKIREKEKHIRSCYAETILQSSDDFVKMILIDACFVIEYFLRCPEPSWCAKSDPIISKECLAYGMFLDLILLENQLPFFILEDLFTLTWKNDSFLHISFNYFRLFCKTIEKPENEEFTFDYFRKHHLMARDGEYKEAEVQHFTDLLRIFHLPCRQLKRQRVGIVKHLYSANQLLEAGVKFERIQNKSLMEVQFKDGILKMPLLEVDDGTKPILLNMAAFEQCHYTDETYVGDYIHLLDLLINDRKDADIIVQEGLIICIGDIDDKVATAFNNIGRGMVLGCNADYLELSKSMNHFYEKPLHKYKAIFIHDYLSTPWKIASFIAAIVLLLLTLIQTILSIIQLL